MGESRVWWITGASSGLGFALAQAALSAGHRVVASARNVASLSVWRNRAPERALVLPLDVCDAKRIPGATAEVLARFGRIDVLVNNAGYGLLGAIEETSRAEAQAQMETNFFGALAMTQAVLGPMRAQRYGRLLQISSVAGYHASPGFGLYNASKFALEGFSEALALEAAPLGIKVVIVEPGPFRTAFAAAALRRAERRIADYVPTVGAMEQRMAGFDGTQPGDPVKAAQVMLDVARSDDPPLRLPLGRFAHQRVREKTDWMLRDAAVWRERSLPTEFGD